MKRKDFLKGLTLLPLGYGVDPWQNQLGLIQGTGSDRSYWAEVAARIALPVLDALSVGELSARMPCESKGRNRSERLQYTHLEAFGRLASGLSPWLNMQPDETEEGKTRKKLRDLFLASVPMAVDPGSPDYMNFSRGSQPLVDAAFLAIAFIRAPELYHELTPVVRQQLVTALQDAARIKPYMNNWLLFPAAIEAFLLQEGEEYRLEVIEFALQQHLKWYKGDGTYGDGDAFHWDYYNSYVIHPFLNDIAQVLSSKGKEGGLPVKMLLPRSRRYAMVLERLISPEGTYPPLGRSVAYRFGAFHLLAQLALYRQLPEELPPPMVRSAFTAVIRKTMEAPGTCDEKGWLQIGLAGHQPGIGESYISTGSLYLCATGLLPLGLPSADPFWSNPPADWTSRKIWSGKDMANDHAFDE